MNKEKEYIRKNHIEIANQAIRWLKQNPCVICREEQMCDIKYKGTCPVWRDLTVAFYNIREVERK